MLGSKTENAVEHLKMKPVIILDLASVMCLLDGEAVENQEYVIAPADDLIKAHKLAVVKKHLRRPEPEFHL